MKTLEELNAKLAEAKEKAERLWANYKFIEESIGRTIDPAESAKERWHNAEQEHQKIALAIKLLTE